MTETQTKVVKTAGQIKGYYGLKTFEAASKNKLKGLAKDFLGKDEDARNLFLQLVDENFFAQTLAAGEDVEKALEAKFGASNSQNNAQAQQAQSPRNFQQPQYQQTQNDTPQQDVSQQHENGNLFSYNHLSTQWSSGSSNIANYDIFNGDTQIGYVKEQGSGKKTAGGIALGALLGFNAGAHSDQLLPYEMHVLDNNGNLLSSLSRGAAMLRQKLSIRNSNGLEIAKVDSKGSKFRTMNLTISNTADIPFFTIHGKPNEMKIMDSSGTEIGTITNRSDISITGSLANDNMRSALITTAVCIDKILTAAGLWA